MQDDSELYHIGDGTINSKLMTGFTIRLTRLSGTVKLVQLS